MSYEYFFFSLKVTGDRDCAWSRKTVMPVDFCPKNKTILEKRIREKGCEKYANLQNCTEPSKFLYHCAINEYGNATVEVCAPLYIINGEEVDSFFFMYMNIIDYLIKIMSAKSF